MVQWEKVKSLITVDVVACDPLLPWVVIRKVKVGVVG